MEFVSDFVSEPDNAAIIKVADAMRSTAWSTPGCRA